MNNLAARLVVALGGPWPTDFEAAWLERYQPAGVILFSCNIIDYSELYSLCKFLHELVPGLEIVADHEGGPISQLAVAVGRPPVPWSLGVLDDVALTARVYEETGRRLRSVGIDRVLAPVADVLTEMRNPVIGSRSFGADPALVARHTVAAVTGLLGADLDVCLKHWPGHGGSRMDSHLAETAVAAGAVPVPFESGLNAGANAVMVGHLLVDGTESSGENPLPATLDPGFMAATRSHLGTGHVENLLYYADDVTMGALGPAMERLGVAIPKAEDSGLYDPALLPLGWFEKLAHAGCDRFLIRGIPCTAFPLPDIPETGGEGVAKGPFAKPSFGDGAYAEARRRLWAVAGADFADSGTALGWLDFSRDDRWAVAAGQKPGPEGKGGLAEIQTVLEGMFSGVADLKDPDLPAKTWSRLLVSSHRPLSEMGEIGGEMASRGVCLAMGHPSLKSDLEGFLPEEWRIEALFDIAPEDLPEPGTKI